MAAVGSLEGVTVLLAQADSFTMAYVKMTLERAGAIVIDSAEARQLELEGAPDPTVACFGFGFGDAWYPNLAESMAQRNIPSLYLGPAIAGEMLAHWSWLPAPFAGYQVVDAVLNMLPPPPVTDDGDQPSSNAA